MRNKNISLPSLPLDAHTDLGSLEKTLLALQASEERYRTVADFTYDWEIWLSDDYRILYVSPSCERITGYPPGAFSDTPGFIERIIHPEDVDIFREYIAEGRYARCGLDFRVLRSDGDPVWIGLEGRKVFSSGGKPLGVRLSLRDVTLRKETEDRLILEISERRRIEEELRKSEERYRTVADFTYDWEIWISEEGKMLYSSPSCLRITGYPPEEFLADSRFIERLIYQDDLASWHKHMKSDFRPRGTSIDYRIIDRNGRVVWISQESHRVFSSDGKPSGLRCSMRDITERRKAEEALQEAHEKLETRVRERTLELKISNEHLKKEVARREKIMERLRESREQLRRLSMYQRECLEEERRRIAREIHDELGKDLTVLNMGLSRLERLISEDVGLAIEKIEYLKESVKRTISSVQRISKELRPGHLDDLGLVPAMRWHIRDFQEQTGMRVSLSDMSEETIFDGEKTTAIYRIFQEALTNAARHSGAKSVRVDLKKDDSVIRLEIADDGVGITREAINNPNSFGLIGMKERVRTLGGRMRITGEKNLGTYIVVEFQSEKEKKENQKSETADS